MPSETIHFASPRQLSQLYADDIHNLEQAERSLSVQITSRDDWLTVAGEASNIAQTKAVFELLEAARKQGILLRSSDFHYTLRAVLADKTDELRAIYADPQVIKLKRKSIIAKTLNQLFLKKS